MPAEVDELMELLSNLHRFDFPSSREWSILCNNLRKSAPLMQRLLRSKYIWHTIILLLVLAAVCFIAAAIYSIASYPLCADFLRRQGIYFIIVGMIYGVLTYFRKF